jgi:hypothetical protein
VSSWDFYQVTRSEWTLWRGLPPLKRRDIKSEALRKDDDDDDDDDDGGTPGLAHTSSGNCLR